MITTTKRSDEMAVAQGSHGYIVFDPDTGLVEPDWSTYWPDEDGHSYEDILVIDVKEWRKTYPNDDIKGGTDILDLGYWLFDGAYEPPEHSWRKEILWPELERRRKEQAA